MLVLRAKIPIYVSSGNENNMEVRIIRKLTKILVFILMFCIMLQSTIVVSYASEPPHFGSIEEAGIFMRDEFLKRERKIEFYVNSAPKSGIAANICAIALNERNAISNDSGDYLDQIIRKYSVNVEQIKCESCLECQECVDGKTCDACKECSECELHFTYILTYFTTLAQEEAIKQRIASVLPSLNLKNDYNKVKSIYDYLCKNISFDYSDADVSHSAYGAIVNKTAVCQGFATLFYRMCKEAGVKVRIVYNPEHAWNIVELDGVWYNLDATWDSENWGTSKYGQWFLKPNSKFPDHPLSKTCKNLEAGLNMATSSYVPNNDTPSITKASTTQLVTKEFATTVTSPVLKSEPEITTEATTTTEAPETTTEFIPIEEPSNTEPSTISESKQLFEVEEGVSEDEALWICVFIILLLIIIALLIYGTKSKRFAAFIAPKPRKEEKEQTKKEAEEENNEQEVSTKADAEALVKIEAEAQNRLSKEEIHAIIEDITKNVDYCPPPKTDVIEALTIGADRLSKSSLIEHFKEKE